MVSNSDKNSSSTSEQLSSENRTSRLRFAFILVIITIIKFVNKD